MTNNNLESVCKPQPSDCSYWNEKHFEFINSYKSNEFNVLFIGASIIENIQYSKMWPKYFAPLNSVNFGISGERVENLLYRLENGAIDSIKAKIIIYMIGSNNVVDTDADEDDIAAAIFIVAKTIRLKQPEAFIVSLSIPPKGREPNFTREIIENINKRVENSIIKSGDEKMRYLWCNDGFLNKNDGTLDYRDYIDWLHFTDSGYEKYCEPILKFIKSVL